MGNARSALAQAQLFLNSNRPQESIRILETWLAEVPDDVPALRMLAQAQLAATSGPVGGACALEPAERAVELDPNDAISWRVLSICYSRIGSHPDARKAARRARDISPNEWVSHTVVANADASAGAVTDDTRASIAAAMSLAPGNPEVHFAAGRVAQTSKQNAAAAEHYKQTLAINPEHAAARNNLALIEMRRGNTGTAAAGFSSLLAENPNSAYALRNLQLTAFRTLRVIYFILVAALMALNIVAVGTTGSDLHLGGAVVAGIAIVGIAGYVLWIRHRAGVYFERFVRSIPSTDKYLATWAALLVGAVLAIVVAIFLPQSATITVYSVTEVGLIVSVLVLTVLRTVSR